MQIWSPHKDLAQVWQKTEGERGWGGGGCVKGKEQGKVKQTLFFSRERTIVIFKCIVILFGNKLYIKPSTMYDLDFFVN